MSTPAASAAAQLRLCQLQERRLQRQLDSSTRMADIDGTAHFCIVDPTDSTILQPLSIDATTIKQANANLLSGEDMIRKLGFSLILDPGTVTGFYKFEKPLSISRSTLSQNRVVQEIPATYDPERRMWLVHFVMARSRTEAIDAAQEWHGLLPRNVDRNQVMMASDHVDTWLNIYASAGGAYCVYTENGICSAEAAYSAGEMDTVFSNMDTFQDRDFQRNLQIFSSTDIDQSKFSG